MDHIITIKVPLLIPDVQKERLERMRKRDSDIMLISKEYWGNTGLGRFLPKNTPKVKSIKRGERPSTAKEVEVTSVPAHVVWDDDTPGGININPKFLSPTMTIRCLKSMEKPPLREYLT